MMTGMSVLRIPQPQAEEQLAQFIAAGHHLLRYVKYGMSLFEGVRIQVVMPQHELEALWDDAIRWHSYNQTRIDVNLGGEASHEHAALPPFGYAEIKRKPGRGAPTIALVPHS
jgi:hypothetical protein